LTAAETVSGGTGNDILQFAAGTLVVAASDLVNVSSVETIQIQNSTQTASLTITDAWFTANGTTSLGITATTQTSGATTLAASTVSAANSISLNMSKTDNSASNVINMGSGNDTLTVDLQALNNTTTLAGGAGTDTLVISANTGSANITQDATVTGWETVSFATAGIAGTFATTVNDAGVAAAATQTINGSNITGTLLWNGAAELDGKFSITGGSGADSLTGGSLVDTISGGIGADVLTGGLGADSLTGGVGADTFVYALVTQSNGSNTDTITDFTTGTDKLQVTLDYSTLVTSLDINAVRSSAGVAGSSAAQDTLSGQRGQYVYDTTGSSLFINFNADNLLTTADYKININAASTASASIVEGDINFVITGGTAGDVITSGSGADTINGGTGGGDLITAGAGADNITVAAAGADTIIGGQGADTIELTGTGAVDTIRFASASGTAGSAAAATSLGIDVITNFTGGTDILNFSEAALGNLNGAAGVASLDQTQVILLANTTTAMNGANAQIDGAGAVTVTNGAFAVVGTNAAANTVALYFITSGADVTTTIAAGVTAGTVVQIATIGIIGSALVLGDFIGIA